MKPLSAMRLFQRIQRRVDFHAVRFRRYLHRNGVQRKQDNDFSLSIPFAYPVPSKPNSLRIAAVCHIYFTDLTNVMLRDLENIPFPCDLYVSTDSEEKLEFLKNALSNWNAGSVEVRLAENRGRDIAPKLVTFADVYARYDLLVFSHSKKTPHAGEGQDWRSFLTQNILGSPKIVSSIIEIFSLMPTIGMVIPQHYEPIREGGWLDWTGNYNIARRLAGRMGIILSPKGLVDFPSGSMFWSRSAAMAPLLKLNLSIEDFPPEKGQWDKTTAHAIERLFLYVCEKAGYDWIKVAQPELFEDSTRIQKIENEDALKQFIERYGIRLLESSRSY